MGWVGLGWIQLRNWRFYSHAIGVFIICYTYLLKFQTNAKKAEVDPFAELCDGTSTFGTENDTNLQFSGRNKLATYNAMKVPAACGGPLNCPVLSQVARRVLTISASSAQSERDFSSLSYTLTELRTRLSANKVEAVELLRSGLRAGMQAHMRDCVQCVDDVV